MHVMPNSACCTHACLCADPHVHSQLWELTGSRDDRQLSIVIRIQDTPIAESARFVDCLDIGYPYAHISCSGARAVTGGEHGGRLTLGGSWVFQRALWGPPPRPGRGGPALGCPRTPGPERGEAP